MSEQDDGWIFILLILLFFVPLTYLFCQSGGVEVRSGNGCWSLNEAKHKACEENKK